MNPELRAVIIAERDRLLRVTDTLMYAPDYPGTLKQELLTYRQALRDLPSTLDPQLERFEDLKWPAPPKQFRLV